MTKPVPQPGWYPDPSGVPGQRYFDGTKWIAQYAPPPPSIVINNNNTAIANAPVVVGSGPNHALHLILTLLTCGMWLSVWLIVAVVGHNRVTVPRQSSKAGAVIGGVLGGLFLLGLVAEHPMALIPLTTLAGLGYLGYRAYERAVERQAEQAKIAARADAQHRATMSGDSSGLYGQYPPPPLPGEEG